MKPRFRKPDLLQVLSWREWMREEMPTGREGWVAEDLDLVVRMYTRSDPVGRFMLVELKHGETGLDFAQVRTFGLVDRLLRAADPRRRRYLGYYLLQYPEQDWEDCTCFKVNGVQLTAQEVKEWLGMEQVLPSYRFPPISLEQEEAQP